MISQCTEMVLAKFKTKLIMINLHHFQFILSHVIISHKNHIFMLNNLQRKNIEWINIFTLWFPQCNVWLFFSFFRFDPCPNTLWYFELYTDNRDGNGDTVTFETDTALIQIQKLDTVHGF